MKNQKQEMLEALCADMQPQLEEQMNALIKSKRLVSTINWKVRFPPRTHSSLSYSDSSEILEELKCQIEELFMSKNYAVVKRINCFNRTFSSNWCIEISI
jgi:phage gp29-like protein